MKKILLIAVLLTLTFIISCGSDKNGNGSVSEDNLRKPHIELRYYDPFAGVERVTTRVVPGMSFFVNIPSENCTYMQVVEISEMGPRVLVQFSQTDTDYSCRSHPFAFDPETQTVKLYAYISNKEERLKTREIAITQVIPNTHYQQRYGY